MHEMTIDAVDDPVTRRLSVYLSHERLFWLFLLIRQMAPLRIDAAITTLL